MGSDIRHQGDLTEGGTDLFPLWSLPPANATMSALCWLRLWAGKLVPSLGDLWG